MELIDSLLKDIRKVSSHNEKNKPLVLHEPSFINTKANEYLKDCINTGWVSTAGKWVNKFEEKICEITKSNYAVAITNGTDALRLALFILGITLNDEVLVPSLTFVGTVNAISHLGGIPNFVDVEEEKYCICPKKLEIYLKSICIVKKSITYNKNTGRRIKAIIPVHLFGNPANINEIKQIAQKWNLFVIEDAAEALGSFSKKVHCGLVGDIGILSFNGNKIITCGGGGAIITNNGSLAAKAKHLSTTAKIKDRFDFYHDEIGWNDRMPNINAALGYSQLEIFDEILNKKRFLYQKYKKEFIDKYPFRILSCDNDDLSNYWLVTIELDKAYFKDLKVFRDQLLNKAIKENIFLRPVWKPIHTLKMYHSSPKSDLENTIKAYSSLISLPSSPSLV